jgi:hypothetical protein
MAETDGFHQATRYADLGASRGVRWRAEVQSLTREAIGQIRHRRFEVLHDALILRSTTP